MKLTAQLKISTTATLLFAGLFITQTAFAQQSRNMTIVPPSFEVSLKPGTTTEGTMKVINDSEETITFDAQMRDFMVADNHGTPVILQPNELNKKYSAASWIGILPGTFTLKPHEKQVINYYIQIPSDARPGGHYAASVYSPASPNATQGSGAVVTTQLGTLFYINIQGPINENASVLHFNANSFQEYGPVKITTEILNSGDLHIRPKGTVVVKNMIGQTVGTQAIAEHNVFPEKSYVLENIFGKKFMFGQYTARLYATYGTQNNRALMATLTFIVFPWKIATITLLIITIAVLLFFLMKRRKENKDAKPEEKTPENKDN